MAKMTDIESDAIAAWLNGNTPKKYPTGHSAVYDEFGNKRSVVKLKLANLAKRLRRVRNYQRMTYADLSTTLRSPADEIMRACRRHNIDTAD